MKLAIQAFMCGAMVMGMLCAMAIYLDTHHPTPALKKIVCGATK